MYNGLMNVCYAVMFLTGIRWITDKVFSDCEEAMDYWRSCKGNLDGSREAVKVEARYPSGNAIIVQAHKKVLDK